jgi:hypothetical protein
VVSSSESSPEKANCSGCNQKYYAYASSASRRERREPVATFQPIEAWVITTMS